ncbi:MAG: hypothetical protein C0410_06490 [Anaerolinea sp.]|nr:hypothetical protein [Anaerolinea sp.]
MGLKLSHKALKGVAHNFVESFTSLMNYRDNDYVMGHIVHTSWFTGATEIKVDILNGIFQESPLLTNPVKESIKWYINNFKDFVNRSQSNISFVKKAELSIVVKQTNIGEPKRSEFQASPYTCKIFIIDDYGKEYSYEKKDWWYPEKTSTSHEKKFCWKTIFKIFK